MGFCFNQQRREYMNHQLSIIDHQINKKKRRGGTKISSHTSFQQTRPTISLNDRKFLQSIGLTLRKH